MKHRKQLFVTLLHNLLISAICTQNSLDYSSEEETARKYVEKIMPNVEKKFILTEELITKDMLKLSYIDLLGLEYDFLESVDFLRNITATLKQYKFNNFKDELLKAKIKALILTDHKILPEKERNEMDDLISESKSIKRDVKMCMPSVQEECFLKFNDVYEYIHELPDKDKLFYWKEWRQKAGKMRKDKFIRYIELFRKASILNGFSTPSESLFQDYEIPEVVEKLTNTMGQLKPLYKQLHAFIRHRLREHYSPSISREQPLPDHLIEEFCDEFEDLESIPEAYYPFPNASLLTYTVRIRNLNYTAERMLRQAVDFYKSMDMPAISKSSAKNRIIHADKDDDECQTSITSLFNSSITVMCPQLTFDNFLKIHSELIELQRSESVAHLEIIFHINSWNGYSQIFKNAMKLSAFSTTYLRKIGLETSAHTSFESKMNRLYREALKLIPLLNSFIEGKVLVDLLDEKININDANCAFWNLKDEYLGSQPPVARTQQDFDFLATKFAGFEEHDWEKVLAEIISFKLYEGLCNKMSERRPELNECDFSGRKDIGHALKDAMQWGNTKPWPEHFKEIFGTMDIDALPILNYFKLLKDWLEEYNNKSGIYVGWIKVDKCS